MERNSIDLALYLPLGGHDYKKDILAIRYPSSALPPLSGNFGQTLSVQRDPLGLFFLALLLDTLFLGT